MDDGECCQCPVLPVPVSRGNGFVQTENDPEVCKELILGRMREIAAVGNIEA